MAKTMGTNSDRKGFHLKLAKATRSKMNLPEPEWDDEQVGKMVFWSVMSLLSTLVSMFITHQYHKSLRQ